MTKRLTTTRILFDSNIKLRNLARELGFIEKKDLSNDEVIRRVLNIPNLKDILKIDSIKFKTYRNER